MAELTAAEIEARRYGMGGSDAGPVFGMGYGTPFSVWASKIWGHRLTVTPQMQRGHDLESLVAAKWVDRTGIGADPGGRVDHPELDWLYATLDYDLECGEPLECKVTEARFKGDEWGPDGDPTGLPGHYELQLRQQMECVGAETGHLAVLFVDTWELRAYQIEADPKVTGLLVDGLSVFWNEHVVERRPPPITDPAKDWEALKSIPLDVEREVDLPDVAGDLITEWRSARAEKKAAERVEKECKAELGRLLDGAGVGLVGGERAVTVAEYNRGSSIVRRMSDVKQWRTE